MLNKVVILLAGLSGFMAGCGTAHLTHDDILLKIGGYELTVADYEMINNSPQHQSLTPEQQEEKLITEGRILAYALEHRYDTIGLLHKQLDYAMHYYASSVDGYVWNKKVKPVLQAADEDSQQALKEKIIHESQQQVLQQTKPRFRDDAIAEIAAKAVVKEKKWPGVPDSLVLMEYDVAGTSRKYTLADFMEFVQFQPMFIGSLSNAHDVKEMLKAHLINVSLYAQAQQMNMEQDTAFQLFRKRYQYGIFINHFTQENSNLKLSAEHTTLEEKYPVIINRIEEYRPQ